MFYMDAVESHPKWGPVQWANAILLATAAIVAVSCWLAYAYFDLDPINQQWFVGRAVYTMFATLAGMLLAYHRTSVKAQRAGLVLCYASLLYSLFLSSPLIIAFIIVQSV